MERGFAAVAGDIGEMNSEIREMKSEIAEVKSAMATKEDVRTIRLGFFREGSKQEARKPGAKLRR